MDIDKILQEIYEEVTKLYGKGKLANYIPELARIPNERFGMSVCFLDGREFNVGHSSTSFSIQSISKVFLLIMALKNEKSELWDRVGKEPSGNAFNSLVQLEREMGIPRNPFINAGALVTTDAVMDRANDPYATILNFVKKLSLNDKVSYNKIVADSEIDAADLNTALTFFMKNFGNIHNDPMTLIDVYCHHCSLELSTLDLARSFMFLANNGVIPSSKEQILTSRETKQINSLMVTSGLYDNVGDFAYKVGLPGKSGVGGGIVAVMPGQFSVAVWSPELNTYGNSVIGSKALELFTDKTGISIF
jgi:glutaminase